MSRSYAIVVPALFLAACTESFTPPTGVEAPSGAARSASAPVHRASGGGKLDVSVLGVPNDQFGFTALVDADGTARGQMHAHISIPDMTIHATVDCLSVRGPDAW